MDGRSDKSRQRRDGDGSARSWARETQSSMHPLQR